VIFRKQGEIELLGGLRHDGLIAAAMTVPGRYGIPMCSYYIPLKLLFSDLMGKEGHL